MKVEIELNDLVKALREPQSTTEAHPYIIGKNYVVRTVTMTLTGRLVFVGAQELLLEDAAWVADSGRWADFLNSPNTAKEVEPFPESVVIGRASIVDACEIKTTLRTQK